MNINFKRILFTFLFGLSAIRSSSLIVYQRPVTDLILYQTSLATLSVLGQPEWLGEKASKNMRIKKINNKISKKKNVLLSKLCHNSYFAFFFREYLENDKAKLEYLESKMKHIAIFDSIADSFVAAGDCQLYENNLLMMIHDLLVSKDSFSIDDVPAYFIFIYAFKIAAPNFDIASQKKKLLQFYNKMLAIETKDDLQNFFNQEYFAENEEYSSEYGKKFRRIAYFFAIYLLGKYITDQFKDERSKIEEIKKMIGQVVEKIKINNDAMSEAMLEKIYGPEWYKDDRLVKKILEQHSIENTIKNIALTGALILMSPRNLLRRILCKNNEEPFWNPVINFSLQKVVTKKNIWSTMVYYRKESNGINILLTNQEVTSSLLPFFYIPSDEKSKSFSFLNSTLCSTNSSLDLLL